MKSMPIMKTAALAITILAFAIVWLVVWVIIGNSPAGGKDFASNMIMHVVRLGGGESFARIVAFVIFSAVTALPALAAAYGTYRVVWSWQQKRSARLARLTRLDTTLVIVVTVFALFLAADAFVLVSRLAWGGNDTTLMIFAVFSIAALLTTIALIALAVIYGVRLLRAKGRR